MGCVSKSQFIEIQNPRKSPFNMDLVWKKNVRHGGAHIIKIECAYIPNAQVSKFLNDEWNHEDSWIEWTTYKRIPPQENVKMPRIQNHFGHIWYDVLLFIFVIWKLFLNLILYQILSLKLITFCKYACEHGLEDNHGDPNHHRFIKWGCLAQFLIKQLYTRPEVVEIIFYHLSHTQANVSLHMANMILIPLCNHFFLPHECHKPSRTTFGHNWV